MNWVFLALLASFIYSVNVFLDKYLIESRFPDYRALPIFTAILALPVFIILWIFGAGFLNFYDSLFVILSGAFTVWAFSLYLEALIKEEASIVIILIQLVPVIVLTLSYSILGETINPKQQTGFVLLFISSILVSIKKEKGSFKFSKALLFILAADILWALPYIFIKYVSTSITFPSLIAYESFGVFIGGLSLYFVIKRIKKAFIETVRKIKKPVLGLVFLNESLFLGGKSLTYLAVTLGPAALVSILGSAQIFIGILFGVALTLIMPRIFKEDLARKSLLKKAFLGILAFVGVILVS